MLWFPRNKSLTAITTSYETYVQILMSCYCNQCFTFNLHPFELSTAADDPEAVFIPVCSWIFFFKLSANVNDSRAVSLVLKSKWTYGKVRTLEMFRVSKKKIILDFNEKLHLSQESHISIWNVTNRFWKRERNKLDEGVEVFSIL